MPVFGITLITHCAIVLRSADDCAGDRIGGTPLELRDSQSVISAGPPHRTALRSGSGGEEDIFCPMDSSIAATKRNLVVPGSPGVAGMLDDDMLIQMAAGSSLFPVGTPVLGA